MRLSANWKGAAAVAAAFFSAQSFAQLPDFLKDPSPKGQVYQPPAWFARMATEPVVRWPDQLFPRDVSASVMGRPHPTKQKYACLISADKWGFCEL